MEIDIVKSLILLVAAGVFAWSIIGSYRSTKKNRNKEFVFNPAVEKILGEKAMNSGNNKKEKDYIENSKSFSASLAKKFEEASNLPND